MIFDVETSDIRYSLQNLNKNFQICSYLLIMVVVAVLEMEVVDMEGAWAWKMRGWG